MICCNMCKRIEKLPLGIPIKKWVREVQEAGYVLGKLGDNTAYTPRVKSWSVFKAKLAVLEMQGDPNKADIDITLADIPKGKKN